VHRAFFEGYLTALAITEANHPHLVGACRRGRARLLFSEGRWHQVRHDDVAARRYFAAAARDYPALAWKAAAAVTLTYTPSVLRREFEKRQKPVGRLT
jgi:hypothetical protein